MDMAMVADDEMEYEYTQDQFYKAGAVQQAEGVISSCFLVINLNQISGNVVHLSPCLVTGHHPIWSRLPAIAFYLI